MFATTEWLNLWDKGHRYVLGLLRSEGPDSTTYGVTEYELPVTQDGRGTVKASISRNEFSVTRLATLPEITGETDNYSLTGSYDWVRGRTLNFKTSASYTQKDVLFQVGELASLSTDQVIENFAVFAEYTQLWDEQLLLVTGRFGIDQGHMISGEVRDQSTDFTKLLMNANVLKRFSIQENWLTKNRSDFNFVAKMNAQYAEKFLSSVEQFSLGGPNAVRAFGVSDVSVDSGVYMGFELYFDLPFLPVERIGLDPLKPYIFYDYAYGVSRGLTTSDRDATVKGYGMGIRLNWAEKVEANLILATPSSAFYEDNFLTSEGESRFFLDVTYKVH